MNRVCEYIRFAVWFSGIGYIALWPMTAQDDGVAALSFVCGPTSALAELLCAPRAGFHLSPGLHLAGMISAACVMACLALRLLRRLRAPAAGNDVQTAPVMMRLRMSLKSEPLPPRRYVRPRSHFGLRNAPH